MNESLERLWVNFINSDRFRRFSKRGTGSVIFRSSAYRTISMARRYFTSSLMSRNYSGLIQNVKTFCVFIGSNKSGGSMLGSLLDAHPEAVLSDEADILQYILAGFSSRQILHILLKGSRRESMKGRVTARRLKPYSFMVPNQWQGCFDTLRVIGDTTTGTTTRRFAKSPDLVQQLQRVMEGIDIKFIQVIRNPYDPISVSMIRGGRSFENAVEHFFVNCKALVDIQNRLKRSDLLPVKYEEFINHPETNLSKICHFLGIDASNEYLKACKSILYSSPDQYRQLVDWDPEWIEVVKNKISHYDFLRGYSFEN